MWWGQPKLNGDAIVIFTNGTEVHVYDRHKKPYKKTIVHLSSLVHELFNNAGCKGWIVLCGEHMTKSKKDENDLVWNGNIMLWDIIVLDGEELVGCQYTQRYAKMEELLRTKEQEKSKRPYLKTTSVVGVFLPVNFEKDLHKEWDSLTKIDMVEGFVLKNKTAVLEAGHSASNNSRSFLKIRKPTKIYRY